MNEVRYSLVNLVRVAQSFPAAPRIMARLGPLLHKPDTALGDIADEIKHDSTLAARVLRMANSAAFAQSEPVAAIEDAAALIGLQGLHRLVGAVAIDHFSLRHYPLYGFTGPRLRDNSILTALLMEELAPAALLDAAGAYPAGLFRSLGKLALAHIADEHGPAEPFQPERGEALVLWERQTFGFSSNQGTAAILREWHFPGDVMQAIAEHYNPLAHAYPLACLLNLAAQLADRLGHGLPGEAANWVEPARLPGLSGLGPRRIERATERAVAAFDQISRALG